MFDLKAIFHHVSNTKLEIRLVVNDISIYVLIGSLEFYQVEKI